MNTTATNLPPRRKDEIAINARLLYPYVGQPEISYESWAASLPDMAASPGHVQSFRLMTGDDGELALNVDFATYFAQQVASDLIGAIALILIEEGCHAARKGKLDYTNRTLQGFSALALARGQMHAKTLHAFLGVEQTCGRWVAQLKKTYGMKYGSDYVRVTYSKRAEPVLHPKDSGKGDVMLGPRFAMKVAAAEPTRRGKLVRKCLENFYSPGS